VDQCWRSLNPPREKPVIFPDVKPVVSSPFKVATTVCKFVVKNDGMFLCPKCQTAASLPAQWSNRTLMDQVTEYIQEIILPKIEAPEVYLTTRATVNDCLYTADPTEIIPDARLPRHDWTYALWKDHGAVPARIITFFQIEIAPRTAFVDPITEEKYEGDGLYSIVQAFPQKNQQLAHPASHLIYKSQLTSSSEGKIDLDLVKVDPMFRGPLISVPYDLSADEQLEWLIIEPRHRRNKIFRKKMKEMQETVRRNLEEQRKQTNKKKEETSKEEEEGRGQAVSGRRTRRDARPSQKKKRK
jgi:hypothetical protein